MSWLESIRQHSLVGHSILVLMLVAACGLAVGRLKVRGVSLGVAGVLFAGIAFGHHQVVIDDNILNFAREFGLILFVFTIGLQVGPGFFATLRQHGLRINLLAAAIVLSGVATAALCGRLFGLDPVATLGMLTGATTNTPSLGAVQEVLKSLEQVGPERAGLGGLGYAVAYPMAIIGLIVTMLVIRALFRIDLQAETARLEQQQAAARQSLRRQSVRIENLNFDGRTLHELMEVAGRAVSVSRIRKESDAQVRVAAEDVVLGNGDVLLVVGTTEAVAQFVMVAGRAVDVDLMAAGGKVVSRRVIVSKENVVGKSIGELGIEDRFGVRVTRVARSDHHLTATPELRLQFGDVVLVVGTEEELTGASKFLGDSSKALNHTNFLAVFLGIAVGVVLGLLPIRLPGMPAPLVLGLAGGPLVAAMVFARFRKIGPVLWHMPLNANLAVRELGITLFLAAVGLKAGTRFMEVLLEGDGLKWMLCGCLVTVVPIMLVGCVARQVFKMPYADICGLLSGSLTDPPALAFATTLNKSDAPTVAYAAVYPMTMILRILSVQVLALWIC
jgi:putative transport protein